MSSIEMTSREIITRVVEHRDVPRIGLNFNHPHFSDMMGAKNVYPPPMGGKYLEWGRYPELLAKVPNFRGEVRLDNAGNIRGRLDPTSIGEPIYGVFQDGWDGIESFDFPDFDKAEVDKLCTMGYKESDKFVTLGPPIQLLSSFRSIRGFANALADTIEEPELTTLYLKKVEKVILQSVDVAYKIGAQAIFLADDWGMQHATFMSVDTFRELFKPHYKTVADAAHNRGLKVFMHSCGNIWSIIPDLIDAGIDVFQFDQPDLSGCENLAKTFGKQMTLHSPVDIQKIMPTGNRELIEAEARRMISLAWEYADGGLIAKDYPQWETIEVKEEWADWARKIFIEEGKR